MKLKFCVVCFRVKYEDCWSHINRLLVDKIDRQRLKKEKTICEECKKEQEKNHF